MTGTQGRNARLAVLAGVLVGLVAAAWWLSTPQALRPADGQPGVSGQLAMGRTMYSGQVGLAERTVVATSIRPVVTDGLEAAVLVCHREPGEVFVQAGHRRDIEQACRRLVSATGDTVVTAHPADTYLVVEVTRTGPGPQRLCGVDIRYRDGWRRGRASMVGEDVVFDAGEDPLGDPASWPACPSP